MTTTLTPPADAPLPYGITTRGFIVSGDRTREPLAEVIHDAACNYLVTAVNALPALLADHARLTAEVARLRAFKLHVAGCYNSWANGDTSPYAAVAALEAIGDELGEPFAEGDRG